MIARVPRESRERMPLQASATSRAMSGSMMIFPSRRTGTPASGNTKPASLEARICKGNVIWLKMMAGIGIIKIRNAQGKSKAANDSQPANRTTSAAITSNRESRERNSSAPNTPTIRVDRAKPRMRSPHQEGFKRIATSFERFCQSTNREKRGTKKPWEKFGSRHHCPAKCSTIEKYSQPTSNSKTNDSAQTMRRAEKFRVRANGSICATGLTLEKIDREYANGDVGAMYPCTSSLISWQGRIMVGSGYVDCSIYMRGPFLSFREIKT